MSARIVERCSCGATYDMTDSSDATFAENRVRRGATEWREQHRHEPGRHAIDEHKDEAAAKARIIEQIEKRTAEYEQKMQR